MLLEMMKLAYEHPGITFLILLGLSIVAAEFNPVMVVKYEPRKEKEEKE